MKKAAIPSGIAAFFCSGQRRDRTADTRIFSPVLYQLSYLSQKQATYRSQGTTQQERCRCCERGYSTRLKCWQAAQTRSIAILMNLLRTPHHIKYRRHKHVTFQSHKAFTQLTLHKSHAPQVADFGQFRQKTSGLPRREIARRDPRFWTSFLTPGSKLRRDKHRSYSAPTLTEVSHPFICHQHRRDRVEAGLPWDRFSASSRLVYLVGFCVLCLFVRGAAISIR